MNQREMLRSLLGSARPLVMPDAYDGLSARLIVQAGFAAVQCSGFSMALASRAAPESGLDREQNLRITRDIVQSVAVPVMADGEDGYGPPSGVAETVGAFVDAGVAGINLEDQVLPSPKTKSVIDPGVMCEKIRAAREAARARNAADLVLNARTDALAAATDRASGLEEAIRRGNRYFEAGADLVFVTAVATPAEARHLVKNLRGPVSIAAGLPYNLRSLSVRDLREAGVARVSLPGVAVYAALRAVKQVLELVRQHDGFEEIMNEGRLCSPEELAKVVAG